MVNMDSYTQTIGAAAVQRKVLAARVAMEPLTLQELLAKAVLVLVHILAVVAVVVTSVVAVHTSVVAVADHLGTIQRKFRGRAILQLTEAPGSSQSLTSRRRR
jgi:hypothetical protein